MISVENFGISERPHHVHRYRSGTLAATLTITAVRTGTVVFSKRATAELTTRARHTTNQRTLGVLVDEIVYRWTNELDVVGIDRILVRSL